MTASPLSFDDKRPNLFTLSFPLEIEKKFSQEYSRKSLRQVRFALLLAMVFYGVFGFLDAWLAPEVKVQLWLIRYAGFIPLTLAVFLFSFSARFSRYMQLSLAVVVLAAGLGIVAMVLIAPYPVRSSYYAGLILVLIFCYTFFKLRFIWATLAGWAIVAAYEIGAVWFSETPLPLLINNNFFFLGANVIGMLACYSIEFSSRREFIHTHLLEEEQEKVRTVNEELEKRVQERTGQLLESNKKLRQEVAERKKAEEALRESEQRFRSLSENSPEIIYTLGRDGSFTYVNPAWEAVLGHRSEEVVGKFFIDFAQEEDAKQYVRRFKEVRDKTQTLRDVEGILIGKDGSPRLFSLSGAPNCNSEGEVTGMVGLLKDITEQQKLQMQFQQAQKMEAIGTLAGGIAHDFNNLLQAVLGYSDLLLLEKRNGDSGYRELIEVKHAAERGAELAQQLLTFSRKVESRLRPTDLNHELKQTQKLLQRMLPKMIEIETRLEENLWTVNADPAQLTQVVMNLAVNAKDAMPEGGRLLIETENVSLGEDYCKSHLEAAPGAYVLLSVTDSGQGIEKEMLSNIFEPFYTTKEIGKGTGLGLAMVYGIVKNHAGHIACYSEPGEGTSFKIYLPVIEQLTEEIGSEEVETSDGGDETILLVDDDESIRDFGVQILEKYGYRVLAAGNGEEAVQIYRDKEGEIDMVVLDLIMPGMGGKRCLEALLELDPRAEVLIASGYSAASCTKETVEAGAKGFIRKPYGARRMLKAVREVLDASRQPPPKGVF